jgi:hypothetical protein
MPQLLLKSCKRSACLNLRPLFPGVYDRFEQTLQVEGLGAFSTLHQSTVQVLLLRLHQIEQPEAPLLEKKFGKGILHNFVDRQAFRC